MAGFFQQFAKGFAEGFFGNAFMRDYTHASKTFRTNAYQYSPKFKYLYHVYFDLNYDLIPGLQQIFGANTNLGLLVKNIQLPKFAFDLHKMNQYNRTRWVQTKINYDPISITFNDDNGNLSRQLWYSYYSYYYKDAANISAGGAATAPNTFTAVPGAINERNIYKPSLTQNNDYGYIGESAGSPQTAAGAGVGATKPPFFRGINIYGFNQHNFVLYSLVNPIIESFGHDTYNYYETNGTMENTMTLRYEFVNYYDGAIDGNSPGNKVKEFGSDQNYDRQLSPIARLGANRTILGKGGLVDAAGGFLDSLNSNPPNYLQALQIAGTSYNTFKNVNIKQALKSDVVAGLSNSVSQIPNRQSTFSFPVANSTPTSTPASDPFRDGGG